MSTSPLPQIFEDNPSSLPPDGAAGGDLSGTYPNPAVVDDSHAHTGSTLSEITHASVASANIDGDASTPSMRRLGTGAQEAAAGNDSRLSDARTPTAHATTHQHGGSDPIATATPAANAIPKADSASTLDAWISSADTSTPGLVQLATDGETSGSKAVTGTDGRLSNARTPTSHATSHQHGGSDEIAAVTPAANAIPKADGSALLDAWVSTGGTGFFGDGSDGNGEITGGVSTLGRDMFYASLIIRSSGTLKPSGYIVHVLGTLTIESGGLITDPGNAASGSSGGVGLGARGTLATDSGGGANGAGSGGGGGGTGATATPTHHNTAGSYQGGSGGNAGGNNGGPGGNPSSRTASSGSIRSWPAAGLGHAVGSGALRAGGGGGGGGGGASLSPAVGGGGGGGGGSVVVRCRVLDSAGTISAPGANGGNGSGGDAGGGGGGAGGWVVVCAGKVINQGTVSALGGSGGTGAGSGGNGISGNNGFTIVLRGTP